MPLYRTWHSSHDRHPASSPVGAEIGEQVMGADSLKVVSSQSDAKPILINGKMPSGSSSSGSGG